MINLQVGDIVEFKEVFYRITSLSELTFNCHIVGFDEKDPFGKNTFYYSQNITVYRKLA